MECPNCHRHARNSSERCPACGKTIPPAQYLLEESGIVPPSTPAPTSSSKPGAARRPTARLATLGDRFIAAALDAVVLLAIFAVADAWTFLRWSTAGPAGWNLTTASLLMAVVFDLALFFVYCWLLEAAFGATLGKLMVGLLVVPTDQRGMLAASAIRNALRLPEAIVFYLPGVLVASCTRFRQRVGDVIAHTAVIEQEAGRWWKAAAVASWAAVLAACAWALPHVCAREFASQPPRYLGQTSAQLGWTEHSTYLRFSRLRVEIQLAPAAPGSEAANRVPAPTLKQPSE